jgi:hypothetical protein
MCSAAIASNITRCFACSLQRFRPITVEKPKVLLPLVNVPLLEYTLEWLALNKVEEVCAVPCSAVSRLAGVIAYSFVAGDFAHATPGSCVKQQAAARKQPYLVAVQLLRDQQLLVSRRLWQVEQYRAVAGVSGAENLAACQFVPDKRVHCSSNNSSSID